MSVRTKMTAIADEIRTLSGSSVTMGLNDMAIYLGNTNSEVDSQSSLITQILSVLDGKTYSRGSSETGATFTVGDFTYTTSSSNPGTYDFILTSNELQSSTRRLIVLFVKSDTEYSEIWKVFYRNDLSEELKMYIGSKSYIYHGTNTSVSENSVEVVATSIASDTFTKFWFVAI